MVKWLVDQAYNSVSSSINSIQFQSNSNPIGLEFNPTLYPIHLRSLSHNQLFKRILYHLLCLKELKISTQTVWNRRTVVKAPTQTLIAHVKYQWTKDKKKINSSTLKCIWQHFCITT